MSIATFPEFTWDEFSWTTSAKLPTWSGYQIRNGPYGGISAPGPSDGTVGIVFAPEGREDEPLSESEGALVRWVIENEQTVHDAMLQRLFADYPGLRAEFLDCFLDEEMAKQYLPELNSPEELKNLMGVVSINVHQIEGAKPYIGVELGCTWDDEHGVGVLLHGSEPLEVGGADTAIYLWIAKKYAEKS